LKLVLKSRKPFSKELLSFSVRAKLLAKWRGLILVGRVEYVARHLLYSSA